MTPYNWNFPYSWPRKPVLAANVVATTQPLAAQAGLRMMLQGGNAVDAILATAITLTLVEPVSNGIGSDLFAILWDGKELHGINSSGRSPAGWTPEYFAAQHPGQKEMPKRGWNTVTVPGCVAGWRMLSERFGKLAFEKLFEPAIGYGRNGFLVSPTIARQWAIQAKELLVLGPDEVVRLMAMVQPVKLTHGRPGVGLVIPEGLLRLVRISRLKRFMRLRIDILQEILPLIQGGQRFGVGVGNAR